TQYGPGTQWLVYRLMTRLGHFDIVGFRMACAALNFAALLAVAIAACWWMHWAIAAAVVVLSVAYSPFAFFFTAHDGTLGGFYGWAFALRYLAPVLVVPAVGRALLATEATGISLVWWGMLWGVCAWLAQENLSTTIVATVLLLAVLLATGTVDWNRALRGVRSLAVGFIVATAPIILWHARHGELDAFLRNYFLVPHAVAAGYSNMWWPTGDAARLDRMSYYLTAP